MPNYYIQAKRGTFNPFSFDEYVKPLNMYKEYYERNEEAITDMQEQANLWKNIMESEKDSKLADKYNTYVNNLNNATQQLKNGMSYNLRNQIQQLRGQSAMVKQIENAYNLRAKDIDAYNQLMLQDPSRIGAYDPSQRKLQEYLNGPVTNEYGVSGDRLYALGNARAKAMSAQRDKFYEPVSALGKQYFELKETTGYSDKEITEMLKNQSPELFNEIDRIIQQEGTQLNNYDDLNTAETYILNGMLSGFTYDEDRKYMKNEDYMNEMEIADKYGLGNNANYFKALVGDNIGLFKSEQPQKVKDNKNMQDAFLKFTGNEMINNNENYHYDLNGNMTSSLINDFNESIDSSTLEKLDDIYEKQKQIVNNYYNSSLDKSAVGYLIYNDDEYKQLELDKKNILNSNELFKKYDEYKNQKEIINQYQIILDTYKIPGKTEEEKMKNLNKFYDESYQIKNYGGFWFKNKAELNNIKSVLNDLIDSDSALTLVSDKDGKEIEHKDIPSLLKKDSNTKVFPSIDGLKVNINGEEYSIKTANVQLFKDFNEGAFALNSIIRNPFLLIDNNEIENEKPKNDNEVNRWSKIANTNISYYLYLDDDGQINIHLVNDTNSNKKADIKLFNVEDWNKHAQSFVEDYAKKINELSN